MYNFHKVAIPNFE